jgi:prepilin-type N-terminal cleavage/methylation domain-containing protein
VPFFFPSLATAPMFSSRLTPPCSLPAAKAAGAPPARPGFTLVEVMTAMTIMAIAGTTLLVGLASSAATTTDALDRQVAAGLAQQLLDEICGMRYMEAGGSAYDPMPLGPGSPEVAAGARRQFDDIDDYHGVATTPPTDRWGITLGNDDGKGGTRPTAFQLPTTYFTGWKQNVSVQYVAESNLSTPLTSGTSSFRLITVRITSDLSTGGTVELARATRVVAYVPGN